MRRLAVAYLAVSSLMGCGEQDPIPEDPEYIDPEHIDLAPPEVTIMPGEEKMHCLHVTNDRGDVAIDDFSISDGPSSHHIALFMTNDPKPDGTFEDCTTVETNRALQWWVPVNRLAPGRAVFMPAGLQYVIQFHNINASDEPIVVRDVGRLHLTDPANVTMWVAPVVAQVFDLDIPPSSEHTVVWDCQIPTDRDMLYLLGHMHEWGKRYTIEIKPPNGSWTTYWDTPWKSEWRDDGPSTHYAEPLRIPAGSVIRSTCTHLNTTDSPLRYPDEMCMTFAFMGGSREPLQCLPTSPPS